jgi:hypothetical protein
MEIVISNPIKADIFTGIFQNMKTFTEHIAILFKDTGIYLQTMDSARVSIVELSLPATWFDKYTHTVDICVTRHRRNLCRQSDIYIYIY